MQHVGCCTCVCGAVLPPPSSQTCACSRPIMYSHLMMGYGNRKQGSSLLIGQQAATRPTRTRSSGPVLRERFPNAFSAAAMSARAAGRFRRRRPSAAGCNQDEHMTGCTNGRREVRAPAFVAIASNRHHVSRVTTHGYKRCASAFPHITPHRTSAPVKYHSLMTPPDTTAVCWTFTTMPSAVARAGAPLSSPAHSREKSCSCNGQQHTRHMCGW